MRRRWEEATSYVPVTSCFVLVGDEGLEPPTVCV